MQRLVLKSERNSQAADLYGELNQEHLKGAEGVSFAASTVYQPDALSTALEAHERLNAMIAIHRGQSKSLKSSWMSFSTTTTQSELMSQTTKPRTAIVTLKLSRSSTAESLGRVSALVAAITP